MTTIMPATPQPAIIMVSFHAKFPHSSRKLSTFNQRIERELSLFTFFIANKYHGINFPSQQLFAVNDSNNNNQQIKCENSKQGGRKLFECDVCNMKFSNGANMRRHKMRHTGVKPYECRVCQKRFFRKDHLAEHFTTHTKVVCYVVSALCYI